MFTFLFATPPSGGVPPYTFAWEFWRWCEGRWQRACPRLHEYRHFHRHRDRDRQQGDLRTRLQPPVSVRSVTGTMDGDSSPARICNREPIDIVQNQTAVTADDQQHQSDSDLRPAPATSPIRVACRSARPSAGRRRHSPSPTSAASTTRCRRGLERSAATPAVPVPFTRHTPDGRRSQLRSAHRRSRDADSVYCLSTKASGLSNPKPNSFGFSPITAADTMDST